MKRSNKFKKFLFAIMKAITCVFTFFILFLWMGKVYERGGLTLKGKIVYNVINVLVKLPVIIAFFYILKWFFLGKHS